jgi:predicted ribosomally synthesized peptide with nif11-like leader
MSTKAVVRFMEEVDGDHALQAEVEAVSSAEQVVDLARELGHSFTVDDLREVGDRVRAELVHGDELSEEQLEAVAGGAGWIRNGMYVRNGIFRNAIVRNGMWSNAVSGKNASPSDGTVLYRKKDD